MNEVYVVMHVHESPSGDEDIKMIGVYSSESNAREAVDRLSIQPGFRDRRQGFEVNMYELDKDHWAEGLVSWAEGLRAGASNRLTMRNY